MEENFKGCSKLMIDLQMRMYQNQDWIDNGIIISMIGVILILIGYFVEKKKLT